MSRSTAWRQPHNTSQDLFFFLGGGGALLTQQSSMIRWCWRFGCDCPNWLVILEGGWQWSIICRYEETRRENKPTISHRGNLFEKKCIVSERKLQSRRKCLMWIRCCLQDVNAGLLKNIRPFRIPFRILQVHPHLVLSILQPFATWAWNCSKPVTLNWQVHSQWHPVTPHHLQRQRWRAAFGSPYHSLGSKNFKKYHKCHFHVSQVAGVIRHDRMMSYGRLHFFRPATGIACQRFLIQGPTSNAIQNVNSICFHARLEAKLDKDCWTSCFVFSKATWCFFWWNGVRWSVPLRQPFWLWQ